MARWVKVVLAIAITLGAIMLGMALERHHLLAPLSAELPREASIEAPPIDSPLKQYNFLQPAVANVGANDPQQNDPAAPRSLAEVAAKVSPSVVSVASEHTAKTSGSSGPAFPFGQLPPELFGDQFQFPLPPGHPTPNRPRQGLGSGVVVSDGGIILTNNHVVEGADEITVIDAQDRRYPAKVVGADAPTDLAVLKVEADAGALRPLAFGDSSQVRPGDLVLAIGNPFGVGQTVTMGIVSAKGRTGMGIVDYEDFIQTDAAINPGNSGGALVATDGRLIGINTAILSRTGAYAGIGFAVPSQMAQPVMNSLLQHGEVTRGSLGVTIQDLDEKLAKGLGLKTSQGVLVTEVNASSAADKAGIERGDVITKLDGNPVNEVSQLRNSIASKAPGSEVTIEVQRGGETKQLKASLGKLDSKQGSPGPSVDQGPNFGLALAPLDAAMRERLNVDNDVKGVVVSGVNPNSSAAEAGVRPGDIIVEVNRKAVSSPSEVAAALSDKTQGAVLLIRRQGGQLYVPLEPPAETK